MSKREELIDFMDVLVFGKRHAQNETGNLLSGGSWTQLFNKVADYVDENYTLNESNWDIDHPRNR